VPRFALRVRSRPGTVARCAAATLLLALTACFSDGPAQIETFAVVLTVENQSGAGVGGAAVTVWPTELAEQAGSEVGRTGPDGRLAFEVGIWNEISIRVVPPVGLTPAPGQANPVEAVLNSGSTNRITFRVTAE
jgi:hypothetical protein